MARRFASSSDYVGDFSTCSPGTSMSAYAWVKNPSANGRINTHTQWRIDFDASTRFRVVRNWSGATAVWHGDMTGITTANWNHYAFTYDGTSSSNAPIIYINGNSV